ncbi:putative Glycoside hydrolase [Seiridium cardinale]|uniref:Glycoside hydrolase n=1 Tax=Seiridium cardinale TaxID=138064 RepID=A0ABR2XS72_9PEZI
MKYSPAFIILAACTTNIVAHWNHNPLIVNDQVVGEPYQYIRQTNNSNSPLQIVNSTDVRCNSGAAIGAPLNSSTMTVAVAVGDELGFVAETAFGHPAIQQICLPLAGA